MKEQYIITYKGNSGTVSLLATYKEGFLAQIEFQELQTPGEAKQWCAGKVPSEISRMGEIGHIALVEALPSDLSFNTFWEAYGNKLNRDRTMKLWVSLPDSERIAALRAVPKYKRYLSAKPNIEQKYPDTWLKNKFWNDSYK